MVFLIKYFFIEHVESFQDPPNMCYTWSGVHLSYVYPAIRSALKVACKAQILGKRRSISKNKKIKFWNGTKCKICFTNLQSYFRKKKQGYFFIRKKTIPGRGSEGGGWQKTIKNTVFFGTLPLVSFFLHKIPFFLKEGFPYAAKIEVQVGMC